MLDIALRSNHRDGTRSILLTLLVGGAVAVFTFQNTVGLTVTAMGQIMPWVFSIARLIFIVGVAASAAVVVHPYSLHDVREFGWLTIIGNFLAIAAVSIGRDAFSPATEHR